LGWSRLSGKWCRRLRHGCRTSVFMTLWHTLTSIHDITTKYPKPAELTIWLVIQKV
jgi:hypothetical protein